ncbi:MAG: hypothetical protein ACU0CO_18495 [Shimia sp.]
MALEHPAPRAEAEGLVMAMHRMPSHLESAARDVIVALQRRVQEHLSETGRTRDELAAEMGCTSSVLDGWLDVPGRGRITMLAASALANCVGTRIAITPNVSDPDFEAAIGEAELDAREAETLARALRARITELEDTVDQFDAANDGLGRDCRKLEREAERLRDKVSTHEANRAWLMEAFKGVEADRKEVARERDRLVAEVAQMARDAMARDDAHRHAVAALQMDLAEAHDQMRGLRKRAFVEANRPAPLPEAPASMPTRAFHARCPRLARWLRRAGL